MKSSLRHSRAARILGAAIGTLAATPALAAPGNGPGWLTFSILGAVVLFVVGLLWRMAMSTPTPRGFDRFVARERAEGRIREWRFDEDE